MKYNKLVRDKIPDIIRQKGEEPKTHVADDSEYWQKLKEKLIEEFEEFSQAESAEEFADLLEVIDAIAQFKGFDMQQVYDIKVKKQAERGRFANRIILDEA